MCPSDTPIFSSLQCQLTLTTLWVVYHSYIIGKVPDSVYVYGFIPSPRLLSEQPQGLICE